MATSSYCSVNGCDKVLSWVEVTEWSWTDDRKNCTMLSEGDSLVIDMTILKQLAISSGLVYVVRWRPVKYGILEWYMLCLY